MNIPEMESNCPGRIREKGKIQLPSSIIGLYVKNELEEYGEYEAVTSEGIKIYIEEDYIYLDEDDDVPALEGYIMEIRIADRFDIKNIIG